MIWNILEGSGTFLNNLEHSRMICEILEWSGTFWGGIFSLKGDKIFSSLKVIHYRQIKEYEYGIFIFFSISLKNLVWELDLKECEILLDILISIPLGRPGTLVLVSYVRALKTETVKHNIPIHFLSDFSWL